MRKRAYGFGVVLRPDPLGDDPAAVVAEVEDGHPKIRGLFAFGVSRDEALRALARTVLATLARSRLNLNRIDKISMIVPEIHSFTLSELDQPDQP